MSLSTFEGASLSFPFPLSLFRDSTSLLFLVLWVDLGDEVEEGSKELREFPVAAPFDSPKIEALALLDNTVNDLI